jgi:hypothetical protein
MVGVSMKRVKELKDTKLLDYGITWTPNSKTEA